MRRPCSVLGVALLVAGCASTPDRPRSSSGVASAQSTAPALYSIEADEADLAQVIAKLARASGRELLVDPDIHETVTLHPCWRLPVTDLVARLAKLTGCELEVRGRATVLVRPRSRSVDLDVTDERVDSVLGKIAKQTGANMVVFGESETKVTLCVHAAPWRDVVAYLVRVGHLRVHEERGILFLQAPPRETFQASGAPASTWFRLLANQAGRSIVMPGHLEGTIDAELHGVSSLEALLETARANGYEVLDARGGIVSLEAR